MTPKKLITWVDTSLQTIIWTEIQFKNYISTWFIIFDSFYFLKKLVLNENMPIKNIILLLNGNLQNTNSLSWLFDEMLISKSIS